MKRIAIMLAAILSILGMTATPALAGGIGDFYLTGSCSTPYGTAKITNYDSDNFTTQTYHHGLIPKSGYYANAVIYDGTAWTGAGSYQWGTKKDGYWKFTDERRDVKVVAQFSNASSTYMYSCTMYAR